MGKAIIEQAIKAKNESLSEYDSKKLLEEFGVPVGEIALVKTIDEAVAFAAKVGFPLALKGCGPTLLHKTEMKLVELGIRDEADLQERFAGLAKKLPPEAQGIHITPMFDASREFIAGLSQDPQYGPVVMFGLGGIFTEAMKDVVFRICPITRIDAEEMIQGIRATALLGPVRGLDPVDLDALSDILMGISKIAVEIPQVKEIDINPILIANGKPVAADALIKLGA